MDARFWWLQAVACRGRQIIGKQCPEPSQSVHGARQTPAPCQGEQTQPLWCLLEVCYRGRRHQPHNAVTALLPLADSYEDGSDMFFETLRVYLACGADEMRSLVLACTAGAATRYDTLHPRLTHIVVSPSRDAVYLLGCQCTCQSTCPLYLLLLKRANTRPR